MAARRGLALLPSLVKAADLPLLGAAAGKSAFSTLQYEVCNVSNSNEAIATGFTCLIFRHLHSSHMPFLKHSFYF